jgi:hypothetical protein
MSFAEALDSMRPERPRPGHPRPPVTRPTATAQDAPVDAAQTPAPRTAGEPADPQAAMSPATDDPAREGPAEGQRAAEPVTAEAPATTAPASPVAPPQATDEGEARLRTGEAAGTEGDPAETRPAGAGNAAPLPGRPDPRTGTAVDPAAGTAEATRAGESDEASSVPDAGGAARAQRQADARSPLPAPDPAGSARKAATAATGPEKPPAADDTGTEGEEESVPAALAGRIASREAPPPDPFGAPSGGDTDEEKPKPVAPAAAAQAARSGEPARPAEDQVAAERKPRGPDEGAMTAARHGPTAEARGQDREPVRHDGAADRTGAQTQTQPHPSSPAQTAATPAAAPGETGLPNQLVPVVSTTGPQMMAAEVIQKVAAQTHAPGASVPIHGLAIAVAARAAAGSTRFDIRLDPPELGRIEVQLILDREGSIRSRMVVEKQETLDLLQRDQRNLERALAQAGLDTKEGGIEFSLRDQGGHDRERPRPEQQLWLSRGGGTQTQTTALPAAEIQSRLAVLRGGIDIRI